jgi:aminoglycoside phosphotransferase (APT) family kinase protein
MELQTRRRLAALTADADVSVVQRLERENRQMFLLSNGLMAIIADNMAGQQDMRRERRILGLLGSKDLSFQIPEILSVSTDQMAELRRPVQGDVDHQRILDAVTADHTVAKSIAGQAATILVELHQAISIDEALQLVPSSYRWPPSIDWVTQRLPGVTDDQPLIASCLEIINLLHDRPPQEQSVFCHGDFGFHNLAFSPGHFEIQGVFDFGEASFNPPEWDLRYLTFDPNDTDDLILDSALEIYQAAANRKIDKHLILVYNAVSAITFLAYRTGIPAHQLWCGRTLNDDLAWTRLAIDKAKANS